MFSRFRAYSLVLARLGKKKRDRKQEKEKEEEKEKEKKKRKEKKEIVMARFSLGFTRFLPCELEAK